MDELARIAWSGCLRSVLDGDNKKKSATEIIGNSLPASMLGQDQLGNLSHSAPD